MKENGEVVVGDKKEKAEVEIMKRKLGDEDTEVGRKGRKK